MAPPHGIEDWGVYQTYLTSRGSNDEDLKRLRQFSSVLTSSGDYSNALRNIVDKDVAERLIGRQVNGEGNIEMLRILKEKRMLLKKEKIRHRFPYDWRSKQPVIVK
jgi:isoleucyl-tRNA synthetase